MSASLKAQYKTLTGDDADNRWSEDTLRKKVDEAKAIELHVAVDPEWDEDRLRAEIQIAREGRADLQVKGAVPPGEMSDPNYDSATKSDKVVDGVEVELTRDYWDGEDNRIAKGSKVTVSRVKAREMLSTGLILPPQF